MKQNNKYSNKMDSKLYKEFIYDTFIQEIKEQIENSNESIEQFMNKFNVHFSLTMINDFIDKQLMELKKEYKNNEASISGRDSIRGKLCEEILKFALTESLVKNYKNIFIETKTNTISRNFVITTKSDVNLKKKLDVDILIYKKNKENKITKFYALSVKNSTRERVAQSELVLFLLDKNIMEQKYNADTDLFNSPLWTNNVKVKYGIVVYDPDGSDYCKFTRKTKDLEPDQRQLKKKSTREFDVELFFQDKKYGGGFTILNNYQNFSNTIKYSGLVGKIKEFFDEED